MDCIEWTGCKTKAGYGIMAVGDTTKLTHRIVYEEHIGSIPKGKEIHHICGNRACMNVEHLQLVTRRQNVLMSSNFAAVNSKKTHCPQGHEYNEKNTYTDSKNCRHCRVCTKLNKRKERQLNNI